MVSQEDVPVPGQHFMRYREGDMVGMHEVLHAPMHVFTAVAASDVELALIERHVRLDPCAPLANWADMNDATGTSRV